jgi:hypothetical protein
VESRSYSDRPAAREGLDISTVNRKGPGQTGYHLTLTIELAEIFTNHTLKEEWL